MVRRRSRQAVRKNRASHSHRDRIAISGHPDRRLRTAITASPVHHGKMLLPGNPYLIDHSPPIWVIVIRRHRRKPKRRCSIRRLSRPSANQRPSRQRVQRKSSRRSKIIPRMNRPGRRMAETEGRSLRNGRRRSGCGRRLHAADIGRMCLAMLPVARDVTVHS